MPIVNGDARGLLSTHGEVLDYTKALEVLKEYPERDGLDIDTLLDSDKHGALTYNDFLILPGYIGAMTSPWKGTCNSGINLQDRFPCFRCHSGYPGYEAHLPEGASCVLSYGHCH